MPKTNATLEEVFRDSQHRDWYFIRPGGNWGDHLIYAGADRLAERLGLNCKTMYFEDFKSDELPVGSAIYLHGGGGLNPWGSKRAFKNLAMALNVPQALVVQGPQTSDTQAAETTALFADAFAKTKAAEVHVFAREMSTHGYLERTLPSSVNLHFDHDTALQLSQQDILKLAGFSTLPNPRYELVVSREDEEAQEKGLSMGRGMIHMDPAYYASSFAHWLRIHVFAKKIVSNRLHSAIAAAIMQRPIILLAGNYHKNYSIWEYSLKSRGVEWRHDLPLSDDRKTRIPLLPAWLMQSYKVKRGLMRLRGVPLK